MPKLQQGLRQRRQLEQAPRSEGLFGQIAHHFFGDSGTSFRFNRGNAGHFFKRFYLLCQEALLKRRKTEDGSKRQDNPCPHCGKNFLRPGNLVKHMEKQICLKSTQPLSPLVSSQTLITKDCFPNAKESSPLSSDEPPICPEEQPYHWRTYDADEPSLVPETAKIPSMTRAEEGLHCFWDEDTGFEVLLVQVMLIRC